MHDLPPTSGTDTTAQQHLCATPRHRAKPQAARGGNTVELCAYQCKKCGSFKEMKLTHS